MDALWPPQLLSSRPPLARAFVAVITPALFGAVCGLVLGVSAALYLVLTIPVAIAGGFAAGVEHTRAGDGAVRGVVGGLIFGSLIVAVHAAIGNDAKVDLPHPAILLAVVTGIGGSVLGALGAWLRGRGSIAQRAPAG